MTVTNPVTANEVVVRLRAPERDAAKKRKDKRGLTYTQFCFDVLEGKEKAVSVPVADQKAKHISWCVVKLYVTDSQLAFLEADAEKRGISVSKAIRADIFKPQKHAPMTPVKAKNLQLRNSVPEETRDYLEAVSDLPDFEYTKLMSEPQRFVAIAGILLKREAMSKP